MSYIDELSKLSELKKKGVLTDAEFESQKAALLAEGAVSYSGPQISGWTRYVDCWKRSFVYKGRANRAEYWWFVLFNIIISFGIGFVAGLLSVISPTFVFISYLYSIMEIFPSLAVSVRRLHDVNKSGWWIGGVCALYLLVINFMTAASAATIATPSGETMSVFLILAVVTFLVAFVGNIYLFVLTLLPGTKGENKYGTVPQ